MNYVNCGNFKTNYDKDFSLQQTLFSKIILAAFIIMLFLFPFVANDYLLYLFNLIFISVIGAIGLNILTGATGLISLGHGAFIGVGAYAAGYVYNTFGVNFIAAILFGGLSAAAIGSIFGIPSLRLKGLYLSIATLAAQFILGFLFVRMDGITGGVTGLSVNYAKIFGVEIDNDFKFYYLGLIFCILMTVFAVNIMRTKMGRAFLSIRDNYIAAEVMGVNVFKYKILSFAISSFYAGVAGGLWTFYITIITPEHFTIGVSIQYLSMIIIGGLGKILGSIFGAVFITILPEALKLISDFLSQYYQNITQLFSAVREGVFGLVIILFLMFEPEGLYRRWKLTKAYWKLWPFSY